MLPRQVPPFGFGDGSSPRDTFAFGIGRRVGFRLRVVLTDAGGILGVGNRAIQVRWQIDPTRAVWCGSFEIGASEPVGSADPLFNQLRGSFLVHDKANRECRRGAVL